MLRRQLLHFGAFTLGGLPVSLVRAQGAGGEGSQKKLVVILLRGAVDGLSVVAPYGEREYAASRPQIALAPPGADDGLLKLDSLFGLHPALAPLKRHWDGGQLAFVHASGSPDPTRSHFDAQDYFESGTPGRKSTPDGWMNRLLTALLDISKLDAGVVTPICESVALAPLLVAARIRWQGVRLWARGLPLQPRPQEAAL